MFLYLICKIPCQKYNIIYTRLRELLRDKESEIHTKIEDIDRTTTVTRLAQKLGNYSNALKHFSSRRCETQMPDQRQKGRTATATPFYS